jgi:hypothetical protein
VPPPGQPPSTVRQLALPLALAGAGVAAFAFVGLVRPDSGNPLAAVYLSCPSRVVFGVYCPLCGGTRAARALATGDPGAVLGLNALLPVLLGLGLWAFTHRVGRVLGWLRVPPLPRNATFWSVLGALTVVYGVVRNLPWEPFTLLAP